MENKKRYIPEKVKSNQMEIESINAIIYISEDGLSLMGFSGKRSKHDFYYRFKTAELAYSFLAKWSERRLEIVEDKKAQKEELKNLAPEVKADDIFYTSWGYDQTNYDFLKVLSVSKTGKSCKCQMVNATYREHRGCSDIIEPQQEGYGDIFTMKVQGYKNGENVITNLRGSYPFCNNGGMESKRLDTFSQHIENDSYSQTDAYSGH